MFKHKTVSQALELLQPGTFVKVKGTRDGHGMREIIEVKSRPTRRYDAATKSYVADTYYEVVAWQINRVWFKRDENSVAFIDQKDRASQVTTHMLDKIVGIYGVDANGKLIIQDRF
jgi:hypothetical protein